MLRADVELFSSPSLSLPGITFSPLLCSGSHTLVVNLYLRHERHEGWDRGTREEDSASRHEDREDNALDSNGQVEQLLASARVRWVVQPYPARGKEGEVCVERGRSGGESLRTDKSARYMHTHTKTLFLGNVPPWHAYTECMCSAHESAAHTPARIHTSRTHARPRARAHTHPRTHVNGCRGRAHVRV